MRQTYRITGMTCNGCKASVKGYLESVSNVTSVEVDLENAVALVEMEEEVEVSAFAKALPEKYTITLKETDNVFPSLDTIATSESKWKQLKPLYLIFLFITAAAVLLNYKTADWQAGMLDFMGLFYVVFSFFKLLDLKGFSASFSMYDPLAKRASWYGWVYPFLELGLGLLFLMRLQIVPALWVTIVILGATTVGVTSTLVQKKKIQCACLGTALKLPMTEATFIENAVMLVMAGVMLWLR